MAAGIPYFPGEQRRLDLQYRSANLAQLVQRASDLPQAALVIELGRYLVGEAAASCARVVDRKVSRGRCSW